MRPAAALPAAVLPVAVPPAGTVVHVVVPDAVDDPLRPSGGNRYDRRLCDLLPSTGWRVQEHAIPDAWPRLGARGGRALAELVARLPDGAVVLVDGLIAEAAAPVLVPAARRVRLAVLVHSEPGEPGAADVLAAARIVITTSGWLRGELLRGGLLRPDTVRVAEPGVDPRPLATGTPDAGGLLCVASVARHKGQDVLLAALCGLAARRWRCRCVGSLDHEPRFAADLRRRAEASGIAGRVQFTGPRTGPDLAAAFGAADVLVHPARSEGYGMVVTEALAHGLPVITTTAGGLPETVGTAPDGARPGVLVPPGDAAALTRALAGWLTDPDLRDRLRRAARGRRGALPTWSVTAERVAAALREAS